MNGFGPLEALQAFFIFTTGVVYLLVGARLGSRSVPQDAASASRLFALWWFGVGLYTLSGVVQLSLFRIGIWDIVIHMTVVFSALLIVFIALWGLVYYLLFVYTGDERLLPATLAFYVVLYVAVVYYIVQSGPQAVAMQGGEVVVVYRDPPQGLAERVLVGVVIGVPLLSAAAYASLLLRASGRSQRYRIGLVSATIMVWLGTGLLINLFFGLDTVLGHIVSRAIGLLAALVVLMAFFPPQWVQERFDVETVRGFPERPGLAEED
ncbi:MAG: hypothetical protein KY455_01885 [Euryarchaeota archaeon]|nr:hypothetical protein [Euryarchaeota archaeon]